MDLRADLLRQILIEFTYLYVNFHWFSVYVKEKSTIRLLWLWLKVPYYLLLQKNSNIKEKFIDRFIQFKCPIPSYIAVTNLPLQGNKKTIIKKKSYQLKNINWGWLSIITYKMKKKPTSFSTFYYWHVSVQITMEIICFKCNKNKN